MHWQLNDLFQQAAAAARRALAGLALRPRSASEASACAPALAFLTSPRGSARSDYSSSAAGGSGFGSGRLAGMVSAGGVGWGVSRIATSLSAGGAGAGTGGSFGSFGSGRLASSLSAGGVKSDAEAAARAAVLARSASEATPRAAAAAGAESPLGAAGEASEGVRPRHSLGPQLREVDMVKPLVIC